MVTADLLRNTTGFSDWIAATFFEDMRDAPLARPTAGGGNHPLWLLGHLAHTEGFLYSMITGESNPMRDWSPMFDMGTEPVDDASAYPSFDEVYARYCEQRDRNRALIEELGEDGLARPAKNAPEDFAANFPTNADVILAITMHQQYHIGQLADARRAAGRPAMFGPPQPAESQQA